MSGLNIALAMFALMGCMASAAMAVVGGLLWYIERAPKETSNPQTTGLDEIISRARAREKK